MSWQALGWAGRHTVGHPLAKALLITIADECNSVGVTFRGPKALMKRAELPKATYYTQMKLLRDKGFVTVVERHRPNSGVRTSSYLVLPFDLKGAWDYFEQLIQDEQIQTNPLTPDGLFRSLTETEASPAQRPSGLPPGLGVSPTETEQSLSGTDPSRVTEPLGNQEGDSPGISLATAERDPAAEAICRRVAQLVEQVDPGHRRSITDEWRRSAQALLGEDGRNLDQVLGVLDWAAADSFWPPLLLSPADLRRHFPRMQAKRAASRSDVTRAEARHLREAERAGYCCGVAGSAPCEADEHWRAIGPQLEARIGAELFGVWFGDAHAHQGGGGELLIGVPEGVIGWVRDRFTGIIEQAAGRRVEVVVCTEAHP